jgi:hypothetical protein
MKSLADSAVIEAQKPQGRSRVSNGSTILPGVDGRSTWVRRLRDLMGLYLSDLGGEDAVSEAERSIIRRIATLERRGSSPEAAASGRSKARSWLAPALSV